MIKFRNQKHSEPKPATTYEPTLLLGNSDNPTLISLARDCKTVHPERIEIVGQWIWLTFNRIPEMEERDWLKARKFRFNPKRTCWQYAGCESGKSHADSDYIKNKYGVLSVKDEEDN